MAAPGAPCDAVRPDTRRIPSSSARARRERLREATRVTTPAPAHAIHVGAVERELETLWRQALAGADPEHPVVRACMSNILVLCRNDADAAVVMTELPEILAAHPARAIVLVADATASPASLDAYVAGHRHLREDTQVCGESVTLTGRGVAVAQLPATSRALLVGDLPTTLWWATPEAPALGALFSELSAMASQVLFDSRGWLEPVRGMTAMGRLRHDRPLLADICWRRLRGWRRILSQGLDPAFAPGTLAGVGEVVLEHGPHALTQAWLLVGWLACRLRWRPESGKVAPGTELQWRFGAAHGRVRVTIRRLPAGPAEVLALRVGPMPGVAAPAVVAERQDAGRLAVRTDGPGGGSRSLALPDGARAGMIARQLSDLAPDPLFRDTFAVACAMAASLPH
jgi:glucose-6-phosphate dehydrogenase assembly protein OpcA